jgi:nucleoside-diphosphate kinase
MKTKQASKELLEQHYKDLVEKPFFPKLRDYMLRYVAQKSSFHLERSNETTQNILTFPQMLFPFGFLVKQNSGPVVCMVWEGKEAVATGRKMLGATNPLESAPGTIRGDFCIEVSICHTQSCYC